MIYRDYYLVSTPHGFQIRVWERADGDPHTDAEVVFKRHGKLLTLTEENLDAHIARQNQKPGRAARRVENSWEMAEEFPSGMYLPERKKVAEVSISKG